MGSQLYPPDIKKGYSLLVFFVFFSIIVLYIMEKAPGDHGGMLR